jgi:hypothetical protein
MLATIQSRTFLSSHLLSKNTEIRIYKTINLPVVLYGCETWSLTLREEHRLSMFENRLLQRIFGLKRDEVMADWRKLYNEELHNVYSSINILRMIKPRRMRWAGHVARMGRRGIHIGYWWDTEGKRQLEDQDVGGWTILK